MIQKTVFSLLEADVPYQEYEDKLMQYGQFVGSWKMDATWFDPKGGQLHGKGEWHFAWVLGGRGIQDVLLAEGAPSHQYGTTLRCYDPALDAWHITWMQPYGGEYVHLTGRKVGDRIVNEGVGSDSNRRRRWIFSEITPDSFLWHGEVFLDESNSWFLEQEMRGTCISS